jgi:hypothetical protein
LAHFFFVKISADGVGGVGVDGLVVVVGVGRGLSVFGTG